VRWRNSKFKIQNSNSVWRVPATWKAQHLLLCWFHYFVFASGILHFALFVSACGGGEEKTSAAWPAAPAAVQVGQENIVSVRRGEIVAGPIISGELRAKIEATVRAEIGGPVVQVNVEEGQSVRKGVLLGRIEATAIDDARRSAASVVTSAENQLAVARREAERTEQLVSAGALAARDLDLAKANVVTAEAQVADARARLVAAQEQAADAVLRAPIDGIVSDRAVNAGDVVSPGTALFTIIDPRSMRLEASVPSEELSALRVGAAVQFSVRGYEQPFQGRIERISPQADPITRQVPIFVAIPNVGGRLVAGLFAEGRVVTAAATGLIVPQNAVNTTESAPWVLRVSGGKAEKVAVTIGLRDPRTERLEIKAGLNDGDILLRGAAQGITPGTPVNVGNPVAGT
jgi:membrane fusion protein (multidrug efflux system)